MKLVKSIIALLLVMLASNSCFKDDSRPYNERQSNTTAIDNLSVSSNFDWKTTKKYQLTLKGNLSRVVKIASMEDTVYQKVFLKAGTDCVSTISIPATEDSIQLIYNNQKIKLLLSGSTLTYSF
ncbi:MAG: hypothetical protein Q8908_04030 [Bacteroidota bacterium]|nr:hypothetical protein [Bacteroidota bacterium]